MGNGTATAVEMVELVKDGQGGWKVDPKKIEIKKIRSFAIHNTTTDEIKIHMGKSEAFKKVREDIPPDGVMEFEAKDVAADTECSYAIFCMDAKDFAHCDSMPIIIVKPK